MRIKSSVNLATLVIISVVLVYSAFAVIINRTLQTKYLDSKTASEVRITFDQLRALTTDYMLYQTERGHQQWWTVQGELLEKLNGPDFHRFQRKYQIEDLGDRLMLMGQSFTKLTAALEKTGLSGPEDKANEEFQNRLITQILVISREIGTTFDKTSEKIGLDVLSLQRRSIWLDIIALLILISFILANSVFLSRSVVKPVLKLHEGAEIIGRGNFDYRVETNGPGEIQELSRAFNDMTANLMKLTVSRDELAREVQERQQAQEALRRAHEKLEQRVKERTTELRLTVAQLQEEVTERQQAEEALTKSEERLRALVTASSDVVYRMSPDWSKMLQLHGREFIPDTERPNQNWLLEYIHPDDRSHVIDVINEAIRTKSIFELEHRVLHVDGNLGWTFSRAVPLLDADGEIVEWFGAASDISERKLAEEALRESEQKLRHLATQILSAQEQERKLISMDLHEGLGQSLTALKLHLRFMQKEVPEEAVKLKEEFNEARNLLREMIEEVRHISRGLSPTLLENLGLSAALRYLLNEFKKYQDARLHVDTEEIQNLFSPQTEINIFRIFQEALNNIVKHAQATQVSVSIKRQDGRMNFIIKDNGVGFDFAQVTREEIADKGMGLAAMAERLRMIGAQLNILSQQSKGTEISFSIPIEK